MKYKLIQEGRDVCPECKLGVLRIRYKPKNQPEKVRCHVCYALFELSQFPTNVTKEGKKNE